MEEKKLALVKDHKDLRRDTITGAIVNICTEKLEQARLRKETALKEKLKLRTMEERLNTIESKMDSLIDRFEQTIEILGKL